MYRGQSADQSDEQPHLEGRGEQPQSCSKRVDGGEGGLEGTVAGRSGQRKDEEEVAELLDDEAFTAYVEGSNRSSRTKRRALQNQQDDNFKAVRKRGLICACNYSGTERELLGPMNDASTILKLLKEQFDFTDHDVRLLLDNNPDKEMHPTRQNMLEGFSWLLHECQPGDSLFFFFSGHVGHELHERGSDNDSYNETLVPCDAATNGAIVDDIFTKMLVNPLPRGVRLHILVDACFSGRIADLRYRSHTRLDRIRWVTESIQTPCSYHQSTAGGRVYQISVVSDRQLASDSHISAGAATFAFAEAIRRHGRDVCYGQLLLEMHRSLGTINGVGSDTEDGSDADNEEFILQFTQGDIMHRGALCLSLLINLVDHAEASRHWGRHTPVLSSNEEFDLYTPLQL